MEVAYQKWFQNNKRLHTWMDHNRDNHMSPYFCVSFQPHSTIYGILWDCVFGRTQFHSNADCDELKWNEEQMLQIAWARFTFPVQNEFCSSAVTGHVWI